MTNELGDTPPVSVLIVNATSEEIKSVAVGSLVVGVDIPPRQMQDNPTRVTLTGDGVGSLTENGTVSAIFADGHEVAGNFDATDLPSIFWIMRNAVITSTQDGQFTGLTFCR